MAPTKTFPLTERAHSETTLRRLLGGMSIFTLLMTVPQALTIWVGHVAGGVSVLSWSAYLLCALLWFWYGVNKGDKNIYLPCIGWIGLDVAIIVGTIAYR